jgi:hypothetical protein
VKIEKRKYILWAISESWLRQKERKKKKYSKESKINLSSKSLVPGNKIKDIWEILVPKEKGKIFERDTQIDFSGKKAERWSIKLIVVKMRKENK